MKVKIYKSKKIKRQVRTRSKIEGIQAKPRLCVYRSNKFIYAQLIDDRSGKTLYAASDATLKLKGTKVEKAEKVGEALSSEAVKKGIKEAIFDRGSYRYHGRVKALADGARKGGLKF